jgi:AcrR family transcriptional regulator
MPRSVDPQRRDQLLQAAVDYAVEHGLVDLTLRPLAQALGVRPNTLVHHFGSKEELLSAVLNGVRDRLRTMRAQIASGAEQDPREAVWAWTSSDQRLSFFRSFFEAYGLALRQPESFRPFLERVVSDWLPRTDAAEATLELAVMRGLLLDLLTTGERERVQSAFELYLRRSPPPSV